MELMHGNGNEALDIHIGLCLTPDYESATNYAAGNITDGGWIHWVDLDLTGLDVDRVGPVTTNDDGDYIAPGEDRYGNWIGWDADVIVYEDTDEQGVTHRTWRLASERAVAAVTHICTERPEED